MPDYKPDPKCTLLVLIVHAFGMRNVSVCVWLGKQIHYATKKGIHGYMNLGGAEGLMTWRLKWKDGTVTHNSEVEKLGLSGMYTY